MKKLFLVIPVAFSLCMPVWAKAPVSKVQGKPIPVVIPKKTIPRILSLYGKNLLEDAEFDKITNELPKPLRDYILETGVKGETRNNYFFKPFNVCDCRKIATEPNDLSHQVGEGSRIYVRMQGVEGWSAIAIYYYANITYERKVVENGSNKKLQQSEYILSDLDKYSDSSALSELLQPASIEYKAVNKLTRGLKLPEGQLVNESKLLTETLKGLMESGYVLSSRTSDSEQESHEKDVLVKISPLSTSNGIETNTVETITIETYESIPLYTPY